MSEVLNFYLEKYGLIEKQTEKIKIDANENAKQRWDLLRKSICSVSDFIEKQDLTDIKLSHGIEFVRRINHINPIEQAVFIPTTDSYLTLDGCSVRLFDSNGRCKHFMPYSGIPVKFKRLQYANCSDRYIAWTPGETELTMLNSSFDVVEVIDQALIEGPIKELLYNEDRNEIISSHYNRLIIWQFRYANKHLIPRLSLNINHKDRFATIFSVERTKRENQRLFLANDCGVIVVELSTGVVAGNFSSLHDRPISALTFFNPLKLLSTGCRDGSIKVWSFANGKIHLKMVFVGHTSFVSCLAFFPGGSQATIASCGSDKTLRVWSLELDDEVECLDLEYASTYIGSDITRTSFFTLSTNFIDIWHQNHLSDDLLSLTTPVSKMMKTDSNKCLVQCRNNLLFYLQFLRSCRIITKMVITKFDSLTTQHPKILSTIHLENQSLLLILIQDNEILHYTTKTNPMIIVTHSQYESDDSLVLLTAYKSLSLTSDKSTNTNLIFSGSKLGLIRVHDITDLTKTTFEIDAHTESEVVCMISDPLNSRLYTSGMDNSIKLWYVYPFALEPLSKILSFFCGLLPSNLININNYLFTVFHDPDQAHYPCVVYNTETRSRYDHSPSDDHIEPVSSISACERMKLFLSSSAGTENLIKIWTHKNVLLRQIEMHFPVHYAMFSSLQGDILTGIGHQVSFIDHSKYLPKLFIKKQVLMYFEEKEVSNENLLEVDEEIFQTKFTSEDRDKLNGIKSVFKYESYVDVLTEDEELKMSIANKFKKNNLERLQRLEDDIRKIQHGEHDKPKRRYETFLEAPSKSDIFNHYFSQIIKYSKITLPGEEDVTKSKSILQPLASDKYIKSDKEGFFPSRETISKIMAPENLRKGGCIPNSTILQSLWPPKILKEKADIWRPTLLSDLDIKQIELLKATIIENDEEETTKYFDWDSDKESERSAASPDPIEVVSEDLSEDLMSKYGSIIEEKQSIIEEIGENEPDTKSLDFETPIEIKNRPVTTKLTKESLKLPLIARKPATMPEIKQVRFVSSAEDILEEIKPSKISVEIDTDKSDLSSIFITQLPAESEATLDKKSILPKFLSRFETESWFNRICPPPHNDETCLKNLPTPLNVNSFTLHLLHLLKDVKDSEPTKLVKAISDLYSNEIIDKRNIPEINKVIEKEINRLERLENETELSLFKSCLHLMASLEGISDKSLVTICLSRFFDADHELKGFLKSILYHLGLEDNTDSVEQELMNFKLFSVRPGAERMQDLCKIISDWLDKWFQSMSSFATECREIISKEMHLIGTRHGNLSKSTMICLENVKNVFHCHILSSADLILLYPHEKNPKSILNYINCLNYFRFKKLLKEHSVGSNFKPETAGPKKTIVSLPKLNPEKQFLVRLGESHSLGLAEKTQKDFLALNTISNRSNISDFTQHPSMQPFHHYQVALGGGFVPFLHLHLKPCLINPFPKEEDFIELEKANPKSLFGSYNKAFIPQFSLPPEPF